jgi:hypothetical protein
MRNPLKNLINELKKEIRKLKVEWRRKKDAILLSSKAIRKGETSPIIK